MVQPQREESSSCSFSCGQVLLGILDSLVALLHELAACLRDPLCYRPPKSHRSAEPGDDALRGLLTPGSTSAVASMADLDTEHQAEVLGAGRGADGRLNSPPLAEHEREPSFHTAVSLMRKSSPFHLIQQPVAVAQQQQGEGVELKETGPNLLLGQYHMGEQRRQLVAPHPGIARRTPPSPEPRGAQQ